MSRRGESTTRPLRDRLPVLPGQAPRRRPGRLHPPPDQGARRPRPPRRGPRRPALPRARRPRAAHRAAQPGHLQRRLPGPHARLWELKTLPDVVEVAQFSTGTFPEPLAFSLRAVRALRAAPRRLRPRPRQPVAGLRPARHRTGPCPTLATLHHPITVDRRLEMAHARHAGRKRRAVGRWYGFVEMQGRVARRMPRIVVVSESSMPRHPRRHGRGPPSACTWCPSASTPTLFRPCPTWPACPAASSPRPAPTWP